MQALATPTAVPLLSCANGTVIATKYGLNYTLHCDKNLPGNDVRESPDIVDSLDACVELCTTNWPLCAGATWLPRAKKCWRKNTIVSEMLLNPEAGHSSFLAFREQLAQQLKDFVCPYGNLATHETASGRQYKVLCGAYYQTPSLLRTHAATMDECMDLCDKHHPLCSRISFGADLAGFGWLNCELKPKATHKPAWFTRAMGHSAEAIPVKLSDLKCENNTIITASDGRWFRTSCNDHRDLHSTATHPLQAIHQQTLQDCSQQCTDANFTCTAAVFDAGLQSGYKNCYLFDDLPPPLNRSSDYAFIYLDSLSAKYVAPQLGPSLVADKAWIAGAVLGPIVVVIGLCWAWRVRTKRKKKVV